MIWNPFIIVSVDSTDVLNNCFGRGSRDLIMLKIGSIQRSGFLFLEKSKLISINKNIVSYANRRLDNKPHMQAKSLFNPYAIKLMSFSDFPWMLVTLSVEFIIPALTRLGLGFDRSASSILSRGAAVWRFEFTQARVVPWSLVDTAISWEGRRGPRTSKLVRRAIKQQKGRTFSSPSSPEL